MLRAADMACYTAKEQGRNRVHVYRSNDSALRRRQGEMHRASRVQRALDEGRLLLARQPIASLQPSGGRLNYRDTLDRIAPRDRVLLRFEPARRRDAEPSPRARRLLRHGAFDLLPFERSDSPEPARRFDDDAAAFQNPAATPSLRGSEAPSISPSE